MDLVKERGMEERVVTVKRDELLQTLKKNKEKHQKAYKEAVDGYKSQAKKRLEKLKESVLKSTEENFIKISRKIEEFDPSSEEPLTNTIYILSNTSFNLEVPRSYEKSYDIAIQMAEWEVNETIQLKQSEF